MWVGLIQSVEGIKSLKSPPKAEAAIFPQPCRFLSVGLPCNFELKTATLTLTRFPSYQPGLHNSDFLFSVI